MRAGNVALLAAVIGCVLLLFALGWERPAEEGAAAPLPAEEEAAVRPVTDVSVAEIEAMLLSGGKGMFALYADGTDIRMMDAPDGIRLDEGLMKAFYYRMAHLQAVPLEGAPSEGETYGLDDGRRAALVLLLRDGSRIQVDLGARVPISGGSYLRRTGDDTIYQVTGIDEEMLCYGMDDLRACDVLPRIGSGGFASIQELDLQRPEGSLAIRGYRKDSAVAFVLTEPYAAALDWQEVARRLIFPLTALKPVAYEQERRDEALQAAQGPDAVRLRLEAGEVWSLWFCRANDEETWCGREGSPDILRLRTADLDFLHTRIQDLAAGSLCQVSPADLKSVAYVFDGAGGTLEIWGEGDSLAGALNGRPLDQRETLSAARTLTLLPPAGQPSGDGGGRQLLRLLLARRNGVTDEVLVTAAEGRRALVTLNGEPLGTTYVDAVEDMRRQLERMAR